MNQTEADSVKDLAKPVVKAWIEVFKSLGEIQRIADELEEIGNEK